MFFFLIQAHAEQHHWMRVPLGDVIVPLLENMAIFSSVLNTQCILYKNNSESADNRAAGSSTYNPPPHVTDRVRWRGGGGFTEFVSHMCQYAGVCSHGNKLEPRRKLRNTRETRWERQEGGAEDMTGINIAPELMNYANYQMVTLSPGLPPPHWLPVLEKCFFFF